jgi:glycerophosphoryl diester phosphodiesterase
VRVTKDEQMIVFHDSTVTRVCGTTSEGKIEEMTYEELKVFSIGKGERIPLFIEVCPSFLAHAHTHMHTQDTLTFAHTHTHSLTLSLSCIHTHSQTQMQYQH